jgi:hypothetical protein
LGVVVDSGSGIERREFMALGGSLAAGLLSAGAVRGASNDELVAVWNEFCDSLKAAAPPLLRAPAQSDAERARALRSLTRLLSQALASQLELADPAFPRFWRSQTPASQQGGPNPDTSYIDARISAEHRYRIFGRRGDVRFVTFSSIRGLAAVLAGKPGFVDNLVGEELRVDADGSFEILVARERPAGFEGNFLRTAEGVERINIRQIFGSWHLEEPMELHIERIGGEGVMAPPPRFDEIARAVRAAAEHTAFMSDFWVRDLARFVDTPNQFKEYQKRDPEKRAIAYTPGGRALVGVWKVEPDQALVIEIEPPESPYWGYELGDYWFQVDWWNAFSSANVASIAVDEDGISRTVVSHVDPGGWPNWLSTSGQSIGHMVFRWLESEEECMPRCKLVKLAALEAELPASTPRLTAAERERQLADRRAGLRRRWPV